MHMKKYILVSTGVLLFYSSIAQQLSHTAVAEKPSSSFINEDIDKDGDRFNFSKDGIIAEDFNNRKLYSGSVKNKKLHGSWQSWYQNGALCDSGRFVNGLPDGEWKHWDINGRLLSLRTYNADKYQRIYHEILRYNPRRISFPLTTMYHKNRQTAIKYLHSSYSFPHSIKRIDDLSLQEWVIANITTGNTYNPVFDQSLHHGLYMNYFPDGHVRDSGYYRNGLRQGIWVQWESSSGPFHQGNYNNGLRTKEWRTYDASGRIKEMAFYNSKGEATGKKVFR